VLYLALAGRAQPSKAEPGGPPGEAHAAPSPRAAA
jgi:hypothetical protein